MDSDGLLSGLVGFGGGFLKGMERAEDRKYKQMEFDAKMKASEEERVRRQSEKDMDNFFKMQMLRMAGQKPTPGQTAVDTSFGKDYADYEAGGGRAVVDKNIGLLESAASDLDAPGDISGGLTGYLPEFGQDFFDPKLSKTRDQVRSAIQAGLRTVLGGQYTEKEGIAMFNRAFNPRLSDEENARRTRAELESLKAMAADKENAARYFERNGTLKGFVPAKRGNGLVPKAPSGEKDPRARLEELRRKKAAGG